MLEDADGNVIRPAILWNDQRAAAQTRALREKADARILEVCGNRANPTWTLPQMLWLKQSEPENFARIKRMYLAKDWIRSRFTGDWTTDRIDAAGTLMSVADGSRWSQEICSLIGWDMQTLPPITSSTATAGTVGAEAASQTGLAEGTPVIVGASDTAVETYGAGLTGTGLGVIKLATAATVSVLSADLRASDTVINYPHVMPDHYYVIAATNSCASAHKWLRDTFFMRPGDDGSAAFERMEQLAAAVPAGSEGLFFHPYLNGERSPHWTRFCAPSSPASVSSTGPVTSCARSTRALPSRCATAAMRWPGRGWASAPRGSSAGARKARCGAASSPTFSASMSNFPAMAMPPSARPFSPASGLASMPT